MRTPLPTFLETRTFLWHALYETSFVPREKKISRSSALKVLDHAMIGPEGTDNCHKFVDILGLRTIFPLFMKSPRKIKKVGTTEKEHEGRVHWRNQPTLGALEGMGVGNESYFEKLWCAVEERTLRATFFFFFPSHFLCMEMQPGDPRSRMVFVALVLCSLKSCGSISFCSINKSVREGFVFFAVICGEASLWWKTLLKRVMRWQHMSPPEWCFPVFLY